MLTIRLYTALSQTCVEITSTASAPGPLARANESGMLLREYTGLRSGPAAEVISELVYHALAEVDGYAGDLMDHLER